MKTRIRFSAPAVAHISFEPGDEIVVQRMTPEVQNLVAQARLDGSFVADVVHEDEREVAAVQAAPEVATLRSGRPRVARPATVAG